MGKRSHSRVACIAALAVLTVGLSARGQTPVGNDFAIGIAGSLSTGYSDSFTNTSPASHGISYGGAGTLDGSYYSPTFLSFSISPFLNQSFQNSGYQSITDTSGLTANASLFSGSHYPGYVNFSRIQNGESNYTVPGVANYKTNGDTQNFGIGWGIQLPDKPTFSVGYQEGSSDYTVYGASSNDFSRFHALNLGSTDTLAGFHLSGAIRYSNIDSRYPEILSGESSAEANSDTTTYSANMNRSLPWNGSTWASFSRNNYNYNILGSQDSQSSDVVTGGAAVRPTDKLGLQVNVDYDDNLAGTLYQALETAGGLVEQGTPGETSYGWGVFGQAQYTLLTGLYVAVDASRREQLFLGQAYDATSYGGSANYGHALLGGLFSGGVNLNENTISNLGGRVLGVLSNASYSRHFGVWNFNGGFNYTQNSQTLLLAYTTSGYSYSGSLNRRISRLNWTGAASGSKSLLTTVAGSATFSQTYSMGLSGRWLGASAAYSKANGNGVLTGTGITTVPTGTPTTLLPNIIYYRGTTYAFGVGSTPIKGLTINGNYSRTESDTQNAASLSNNIFSQGNLFVQYQVRKIYFTSGYSRLLQGFSATKTPPTLVSSFYVGVTRWFNFF